MKGCTATGIVLVLLLTGCGGSADAPSTQPVNDNPSGVDSQPPPTKRIMGPGKYTFTSKEGGKGVLQVPAPPDPQVEELRMLAGGEPVTYITAAIDNRDGTESINMYRINIYTPEGQEMRYVSVLAYIDEIQPRLPTDAPAATYNKFVDYYNAHLDGAAPLQVKDFVMVGPQVPDEITGITVYPTGGFNPVQAEPAQ